MNVAIGPLLLQAAPPQMVGRIFAIFTPATAGAAFLATALAGYLASTVLHNVQVSIGSISFGPYDTIYCLGGAIIILSGMHTWTQLRDVRNEIHRTGEEQIHEEHTPVL